MQNINIKLASWSALAILVLALSSCLPESQDLELGNIVVADFTITDISTDEVRNTYLLNSTTSGPFLYVWDLGNGTMHQGGAVDTAFYEERGTYTITLTVLSEGGHSIATQEIVVENDASSGVNVVEGGEMNDPGAWAFTELGISPTSYEFVDETVKFTNNDPAQSNIGMWQAVEMDGGRTYQFSAAVSGGGMVNSWMEVMILDAEPQEGVDPSSTVISGLNTWAGCGGDAFSGNLTSLSCAGDGTVSVSTSGTYYLFIKVGSWDGNLGSGLTVDNIKLVGGDLLMEGDNILAGSDMENSAAWTVFNMGLDLTGVEFTDGVMKFSNGTESTQTNVGVWQEVTVEAGQIYRFSATVNNPAATGSWIEFYLDATVPTDGVDYTNGAITPGSTVSFPETSTMYVLIKVGSWDGNLGSDGVSIDDVTLVELF